MSLGGGGRGPFEFDPDRMPQIPKINLPKLPTGSARIILIAIIGLILLLVFAFTENALVYNLYFTHPLFVLMGAAYGLEPTDGVLPPKGRSKPATA